MKTQQFLEKDVNKLKEKIFNLNLQNGFGVYFSSVEKMKQLKTMNVFNDLNFPVIGCSTSGEIHNSGVVDDSIVFNLCKFETPIQIKLASESLRNSKDDIRAIGKSLGEQLKSSNSKLILLLGVGVNVNGSELVRGLQEVLGDKVAITGGLAGDNANFVETFVATNDKIENDQIVAISFSGEKLSIGYGSRGGWQPFGPQRVATKAEGNKLYMIDDSPALDIYKTYLADKVDQLPGAGLLYPIAVTEAENDDPIIRTILGIDEAEGSLLLAGEVKQGANLRLMHTGTEGLIEGAEEAAKLSCKDLSPNTRGQSMAILVSCVGRKIVMSDDVEDEVDAVRDIVGESSLITGFYSHGEICPFDLGKPSRLHNQTMTITLISEIE